MSQLICASAVIEDQKLIQPISNKKVRLQLLEAVASLGKAQDRAAPLIPN